MVIRPELHILRVACKNPPKNRDEKISDQIL